MLSKRRNSHNSSTSEQELTFWDHLDDLRKALFRSVMAVMACAVVVFLNKDTLTHIIFAAQSSDFVTYRVLCQLSEAVRISALCPENFEVQLLNTKLATPFFTHMTSSLYVGLLLALPVVLILLWQFVAPALYPKERKMGIPLLIFCILLFAAGVLLGYYVIFPLAFRFLGTYQFGKTIVTMVDLSSYMETFYMVLIAMGLVFEMPMLAYGLSRLGIITKEFLGKYRRHAIVVILIIAAFITPTSDPFTLMLVSVPMYFLYELSIRVSKSGKSAE
ncbi:MAG: twin-arginine translocase subunit TatC [Prevotellaceae bacterium]|jgi:sec-independent protein translocase protein TatC|nr:twin-arginine translocase subunit TatC [Prevotellaceae bacterium]